MITPELFAPDDVEEPVTNSKVEFNSLDECLDAHSLAEYIRSQGNSAKRQRWDSIPNVIYALWRSYALTLA